MAEQVKINPVTLDIVKDSLIAVSNEIFYAFAQTSMSPIIYETLDYASGIADAEGRLLTQGNGVTGFIGMISPMICAVVDKYGKENLHPGDVYIINDPFLGGGTHMSDVGMVMPIFYQGELIAFAGNKAHWSDIGGMAPGSFTTDATARRQGRARRAGMGSDAQQYALPADLPGRYVGADFLAAHRREARLRPVQKVRRGRGEGLHGAPH